MTETGTLEGHVREKDGVAGAMVAVLGTSLVAVTNIKGFYRIVGVPEGDHSIQATDVLAKDTKPATITAGQTTVVDFKISPLGG